MGPVRRSDLSAYGRTAGRDSGASPVLTDVGSGRADGGVDPGFRVYWPNVRRGACGSAGTMSRNPCEYVPEPFSPGPRYRPPGRYRALPAALSLYPVHLRALFSGGPLGRVCLAL